MKEKETIEVRKSIKIPTTKKEWTKVEFVKAGISITAKGAYNFKLKSQTIEGVKIPASMEIWAGPHQIMANLVSSRPVIELRQDKVNEILRTLIIRSL